MIKGRIDLLGTLGEDVRVVCRTTDLLSPDILMIYPARLTPGKKLEKVVTFASAIKKKTRKSVKAIFCDFPSSDINPDF